MTGPITDENEAKARYAAANPAERLLEARLRVSISHALELLDTAVTATSYLARRALADAALNELLDALPSVDDEEAGLYSVEDEDDDEEAERL